MSNTTEDILPSEIVEISRERLEQYKRSEELLNEFIKQQETKDKKSSEEFLKLAEQLTQQIERSKRIDQSLELQIVKYKSLEDDYSKALTENAILKKRTPCKICMETFFKLDKTLNHCAGRNRYFLQWYFLWKH
jgi:altronate dehydratase